jgi:hypothetical protein
MLTTAILYSGAALLSCADRVSVKKHNKATVRFMRILSFLLFGED